MKIHGNKPSDSQEINLNTQKISKAQVKDKATKSGKTTSVDKVEISKEGKRVSELMSAIEQLPITREEKIKAIKEAIESGNYQVDPLKIAQKLIDEL